MPSAVPATVSSGKCAPNITRVNATAAMYAQSKNRNRGKASATDTLSAAVIAMCPLGNEFRCAQEWPFRIACSTTSSGRARS